MLLHGSHDPLKFLTFNNRNTSRSLSMSNLRQTRTFLPNLLLVLHLFNLWYVFQYSHLIDLPLKFLYSTRHLKNFQSCVVMLTTGLSLIWCKWSSNIPVYNPSRKYRKLMLRQRDVLRVSYIVSQFKQFRHAMTFKMKKRSKLY